ncbi:stage V sporulation protein AC [Dehalobacter sp. DCM]|uniref:stage V sporulation protein AC n=1 Tax=Dehalobacter sp. DCM TaxID=2907827 RepID=UPI003081FAE3|nr:stage V sporulation protein AC [Dehalobacter sp. DCM]
MPKQNLRTPTIAVTPEEYKQLTQNAMPKPTVLKNTLMAFFVGGLICSIGQILNNVYIRYLGLSAISAPMAVTATLILLGALLTGFGIYDTIVKYGGAGGIIPVSGFANSMVSPALEYKREGYVLGTGGKLFTVAGPILVFGIASSIIVGLIYLLIR